LARQVAKVLRGVRPADIRVEQATNFVQVINSKLQRRLNLNFRRALCCAPTKSSNEAQTPAGDARLP
jgi:ABC-type uncharacterized transport system substrate-binding protein